MEQLLSEQAILLAEGQFSSNVVGLLNEKITALGGTVVTQRDDCTILLVNPNHPKHTKEKEHIAYLSKNYPQVTQPEVYPYHWLACCAQAGRLLSLDELNIISPIFTYPASSEDWRPLRVWVSVNIAREGGEKPEEARDNVTAQLEAAGGLAVSKRALADVLVVDETSNFAKKVHAEKKAHGRDWQRIVERDWVNGCLRSKTLAWRAAVGSGDGTDDAEQDSMAEDDTPIGNGKGLGRPTGKPRTEYTPQDDDFLCRYLAAHHRNGSWASRKTYVSLVEQSAKYPYADRHTAQSWHERFKKNAAIFERRTKRFIEEGVDHTLKTKQERLKTRELKAAQASQAGTANKEGADSHPEAGPSRSQGMQAQADEPAPISASTSSSTATTEPQPSAAPHAIAASQEAAAEPAAAAASTPQPVANATAESTVPSVSASAGAQGGIQSTTALPAEPVVQPEPSAKSASPGSSTTNLRKPDQQHEANTMTAVALATSPDLTASTTGPDATHPVESPGAPSEDARPDDTAVGKKLDSSAGPVDGAAISTDKTETTAPQPSDQPVITITTAPIVPSQAEAEAEDSQASQPSQPASQANLESGESLSDLLPSPSQFAAFVNTDVASQADSVPEKQETERVGDRTIDTDVVERELIEGQLAIEEDSQSTFGPALRRTGSRDKVQAPVEAGTTERTADHEMGTEALPPGPEGQVISSDTVTAPAQASATSEATDTASVDLRGADAQGLSPGRPRKSVRLDDDVQVALIRSSRPVHPDPDTVTTPKAQAPASSASERPADVSALATRPQDQATTINAQGPAQDRSTDQAQQVVPARASTPAPESVPDGPQNGRELVTDRQTAAAPVIQTPIQARGSDDGHQRMAEPATTRVQTEHSPSTSLVSAAATPISDRAITPGRSERKKRPRPSTLREHLESASKAKGKRHRRTLGRDSASYDRNEADIETVYADVSLPPRPTRQTPTPLRDVAASPTPLTSSRPARAPSPVLSPVQRAESVVRGKSIIMDQAREYKERLAALSKRFGLTPSEIVAFMSKNRSKGKGGKGPNPWDEIERGLELKYGDGRGRV
ncbi:hypothetical protein I316_02169 [Kwoniella heveanensis BCC8398]|uniref:BRCT domain-containing protein n=1 Tax=Kwoniella heveanensis BCC8398 TaxID=1296120 RepID=A0A1B9GZ66_9TREE|nr:hypothetical protein I316_02169 [Kwoniella heveanensis BCC8398]